jgi:hypothetical protein
MDKARTVPSDGPNDDLHDEDDRGGVVVVVAVVALFFWLLAVVGSFDYVSILTVKVIEVMGAP